ncbi:MAG: hypothetical protein ACRELU_11370 [Gemmatimonadota bacterium]
MAACSGCSDSNPTAPPDRGSPLIEVLFPTSVAVYDRDSNGLLDLEIAFSDSLSGIDVGSIEVLANRPIKGPAGQGANLIEVWRVQRADTTGFVLAETVDDLLPRGQTALTVAVRDRAGNRVSRTLTVDLPPAARHKVLDLGAVFKVNSSQVTIGPDGTKAYVTTEEFGGSALSIVDLEQMELLSVVRSPIEALSETAVDELRGLLYLVSIDEPLVAVFDLASETFQAPIATSDRGIGVALSRQRDRLYVGLETVTGTSGAFISVIDLGARREEEVFDLGVVSGPNPNLPMGMFELLLDPAESRVFATTWPGAQAGLLVFDPDTGVLVQQVDLEPENPPRLGGALDIDRLNGEFIVTSVNIDGFGLLRVLSGSPSEVTRVSVIEQFLGLKDLAFSPDGQELAITTNGPGDGTHGTLLVDAGTLQVIWEDRFSGEIVSPQNVAFRPDGNVILVTGGTFVGSFGPASSELTIYIHR